MGASVELQTFPKELLFFISDQKMKAFVAMFAAVASAAAEPWLGYGGVYGYGLPVVYGKSAPCVNAATQPVPCAHIGKREAEAEPWLGYGGVYGYGLPAYTATVAATPLVHTAPAVYHYVPTIKKVAEPCQNEAGEAVPCAAGHPEYRHVHHVVSKREAEADPTLYFVNPVGHRYGFPHNGFGQELVHSSNLGICTNYLGQRVPGLGC